MTQYQPLAPGTPHQSQPSGEHVVVVVLQSQVVLVVVPGSSVVVVVLVVEQLTGGRLLPVEQIVNVTSPWVSPHHEG